MKMYCTVWVQFKNLLINFVYCLVQWPCSIIGDIIIIISISKGIRQGSVLLYCLSAVELILLAIDPYSRIKN